MVARVWVSSLIWTPSRWCLASTAWWRPSDHWRPTMRRPVFSSMMITDSSPVSGCCMTAYCLLRRYRCWALRALSIRWGHSVLPAVKKLSTPTSSSARRMPFSVRKTECSFSRTSKRTPVSGAGSPGFRFLRGRMGRPLPSRPSGEILAGSSYSAGFFSISARRLTRMSWRSDFSSAVSLRATWLAWS